MIDILIEVTKSSILGIFTVEKYNKEILDEDLSKILVIRNIIEECANYVSKSNNKIHLDLFKKKLIEYALELFTEWCFQNIPNEVKLKKGFDTKNEREEIIKYFKHIYTHLNYPE